MRSEIMNHLISIHNIDGGYPSHLYSEDEVGIKIEIECPDSICNPYSPKLAINITNNNMFFC